MRYLLIASLLAGCASLGNQKSDEPRDINWLVRSLQDEGVFIVERPALGPTAPAESGLRLVLDSRESLDVYYFEKHDIAASMAFQHAHRNPGRDVYRLDQLVVVRRSTRDTGLSGTLRRLLGATI